MSTVHWDQIKQVFNAALERPAGERPAFVKEACGGYGELYSEVMSLLSAQTRAMVRTSGAAAVIAGATTAAVLSTPISEAAGTFVGPYKLLQVIGEGGFGTVFLADQTEPVRRRVALKIIKLGMDTRSVVARFEAERQALALMDHPSIAKVFDGGSTESGRPYFVMEYVRGDPITLFADAHTLTLRERLELLRQVCLAVQHAHQKGVIHRDIKPSNVLVSMVDGKPLAKVIDFGIAKATGAAGGALTKKTLFTEHDALIGTPEYMSPEQAEGSPDIDTRTDVYGLGVLMYELLTGTTPFEPARLRSAAFVEMRRIIKEEDPPTPSLRIGRDLQRDLKQLASTAAHRRVEPERLNVLVRGELDWIVMKALEKDRARRFATPQDLAADIDRHLRCEAVIAAPPSAGYRVRKFVRRNRAPVIAGLVIAGTLLVGIAGTTWQWSSARRANALLRSQHLGVIDSMSKLVQTLDLVEPERSVSWFTLPDGQDVTIARGSSEGSLAEVRILPGKIRDAESALTQAQPSIDPSLAMQTLGLLIEDNAMKMHDQTVLAKRAAEEEKRRATEAEAARAEADQALKREAMHRALAESESYVANVSSAAAAMTSGQASLALQRLDACPPDRRGWEWGHLRRGANAGDQIVEGEFVDIWPEGLIVKRVLPDRSWHLVNHDTGKEVFKPHAVDARNRVWSMSFRPDGQRLIYNLGDGVLRECEVGTWRETAAIEQPNGMWCATYSADGSKVLTGESGGDAVITELATGREVARVVDSLRGSGAQTVRFGAAESDLIVHSRGIAVGPLAALSAAGRTNAREGYRFVEPWGRLCGVSRDGARAVVMEWNDWIPGITGSDTVRSLIGPRFQWQLNTIAIIELSSGNVLHLLRASDLNMSWDGSSQNQLPWSDAGFRDLDASRAVFTPTGVICKADAGMVRAWNTTAGTVVVEDAAWSVRSSQLVVREANLSSEGRSVVLGMPDGSIVVLESASGAEVRRVKVGTSAVFATAFSPDGSRIVAGCADGTIHVIRASDGTVEASRRVHEEGVVQVEFNADGRWILSNSQDRAIVWSVETPQPAKEFRGTTYFVFPDGPVAFSPDRSKVLIGGPSDNPAPAYVWDVASSRILHALRGHLRGIASAAWSSDSSRVVTGGVMDGTAMVWDARTGARIKAMSSEHPYAFSLIGLGASGDRLVASSRSSDDTRLWNLDSGEPLTPPRACLNGFQVAPQGDAYVVASDESPDSSDRTNAIRSLRDGRVQHKLPLSWNEDTLKEYSFSPDGARIVVLLPNGDNAIYDVATGKEIRRLVRSRKYGTDRTGATRRQEWSSDGQYLVTSGLDSAIRVWDPSTGLVRGVILEREPNTQTKFSIDDARHRLILQGHKLRIINLSDIGQTRIHLTDPEDYMRGQAVSPDSRFVVGFGVSGGPTSNTHWLRIWDLDSGQPTATLSRWQTADAAGPEMEPSQVDWGSLTFSADGSRVISGARGGQVPIWDAKTGKVERVLQAGLHKQEIRIATLNQDNSRVLTITEALGEIPGTAVLWDVTDATRQIVKIEDASWGCSVDPFSPDGDRVLVGTLGSRRVFVLDAKSGETLATIVDCDRAKWSPNAKQLLCMDGKSMFVVDSSDARQLWRAELGNVSVLSFKWDTRSERVFAATWEGMQCFDAATGKVIWAQSNGVHTGRGSWVTLDDPSWTLHPDGSRLVLVDRYGLVHVLDPSTGRTIVTLRDEGNETYGVTFTPDGRGLVLLDNTGITVWRSESAASGAVEGLASPMLPPR